MCNVLNRILHIIWKFCALYFLRYGSICTQNRIELEHKYIINTITWNSNFSTRKICYLLTSQFFLIKTIYSPIDFDVYFPMQCSEFTKIFKKKRKRKNPHFSIFLIKIKIFPQLDLSDGTIRIQNFHFSRKFWRKNSWKLLK